MLPDFDQLGNLPEAVYPCSKSELHHQFVQRFPASTQRKTIFNGFSDLYNLVQAQGISATMWVDGSFTTRKLNPRNQNQELEPRDIDVVTFMDYDELNALPLSKRLQLEKFLNAQEDTKRSFQSHTFMIGSCQTDHPYFGEFEKFRRSFRDWFSRHSPPSIRTMTNSNLPYVGPRKGFLEITIGAPLSAPRIDDRRL